MLLDGCGALKTNKNQHICVYVYIIDSYLKKKKSLKNIVNLHLVPRFKLCIRKISYSGGGGGVNF